MNPSAPDDDTNYKSTDDLISLVSSTHPAFHCLAHIPYVTSEIKQKVEKVWKVFKFIWGTLLAVCLSLDWKSWVAKSDFSDWYQWPVLAFKFRRKLTMESPLMTSVLNSNYFVPIDILRTTLYVFVYVTHVFVYWICKDA